MFHDGAAAPAARGAWEGAEPCQARREVRHCGASLFKRERAIAWAWTVAATVLLASPATQADDVAAVRRTLERWADAFNAADGPAAYARFAPELIATIAGEPERGYADVCARLSRALADPGRAFRYELDLHEVLVEGDLAVARLTWTLTVGDATGAQVSRAGHGRVSSPA
jgi:steroid delta-isomerase